MIYYIRVDIVSATNNVVQEVNLIPGGQESFNFHGGMIGTPTYHVVGHVGGVSTENKCTDLISTENHKVIFVSGDGGVVCRLSY